MTDLNPRDRPGWFYAAPWRFSDLAWFFLFLGLVFWLNFVFSWILPEVSGSAFRFSSLCFLLILEVGLPLGLLRRKGYRFRSRPRILQRLGDLFSGCLTYLLLIPTLLILASFLSSTGEESLADRLAVLRDENLVFQILLGVTAFTVVPVCEEIFFRGFLFNVLRTRLKVGGAVLVQAVLFGILHPYTPTYPIYIATVGIGLGIVYELRKRLLAPVVTHACFNFIGSVFLLSTAVLNLHEPASNWHEAADVYEPPASFEIALFTDLSRVMTEEELLEAIGEELGPDGLDMQFLEAEAYRIAAFVFGPEDEAGASALLRAARIFQRKEDPRRCALLCRWILEEYSAVWEIREEARSLYGEAVRRIGEEPPRRLGPPRFFLDLEENRAKE